MFNEHTTEDIWRHGIDGILYWPVRLSVRTRDFHSLKRSPTLLRATKKLEMTYTSIEQVSQLLEIGIPPETADMYYKYNEVEDTWFPYIIPDYMNKELIQGMLQLKQYKPCWSAENLYNLIPKSNSGVGKEIYPMIIKDSLFDRGYKITSIPFDTTYHEKLVDATIEMLNCSSNQKNKK